MFDTNEDFNDFWGAPVSVYTDADALSDGELVDVSVYGVKFNGRLINRATIAASDVLRLCELDGSVIQRNIQFIADKSTKDREGFDAWGIFAADKRLGNEKLWLVNNEIGGYTLMLPSDY